jgi:hypothetical protein
VWAKRRPLLFANKDNGDAAVTQILLVANVLVRCEDEVKAGLLGCLDEFAVCNPVPTLLGSCADDMVGEKRA